MSTFVTAAGTCECAKVGGRAHRFVPEGACDGRDARGRQPATSKPARYGRHTAQAGPAATRGMTLDPLVELIVSAGPKGPAGRIGLASRKGTLVRRRVVRHG